jgi:hypothetical protein
MQKLYPVSETVTKVRDNGDPGSRFDGLSQKIRWIEQRSVIFILAT